MFYLTVTHQQHVELGDDISDGWNCHTLWEGTEEGQPL